VTASRASFRERYGAWAIVAGASEGLGAAFGEALAALGLNLVLVARRASLLAETAGRMVESYGIETRALSLDLADEAAVPKLLEAVAELDVGLLVYNAAHAPVGIFLELSPEDHRKSLAVNCAAPLLLCHALGARLARRGRGGIILMSSLAAFQGAPCVAHYAATKAYGLVLGEGLWAELRRQGVDVLSCCAGATRTPGYEAHPAPPRFGAPPVMEPSQVVREALGALGRRPSVIPGFRNRVAAFLMRRLFSRRRAILIMEASTGGLPEDVER
jgi:short-subunit dehydrogenase